MMLAMMLAAGPALSAAIDFGAALRCEARLLESSSAGLGVEIPLALSLSIAPNPVFCSVELAARARYERSESGATRSSLIPESGTVALQWLSTKESRRLRLGAACSIPGRVLKPLLDDEVPVDPDAGWYLAAFAGMTRIFDPGALTAAVNWAFGLPVPIDGRLVYAPGNVSGTVLFTEALHPSLAYTLGIRRTVVLRDAVWPMLPSGGAGAHDELFFTVQTGGATMRLKYTGTVIFSSTGSRFAFSTEIERYATR